MSFIYLYPSDHCIATSSPETSPDLLGEFEPTPLKQKRQLFPGLAKQKQDEEKQIEQEKPKVRMRPRKK